MEPQTLKEIVHDEDDAESIDDTESTASYMKRSRDPITSKSVMEEISKIKNIVMKELDKQMKSLEKHKGTRTLRNISKRLDVLEKHIPKIKKIRPPREIKFDKDGNVITPPNSFSLVYDVSKELYEFAGITKKADQKGLSREDVQCIINTYIYLNPEEDREKMMRWSHLNPTKRDLRDPEDKRRIVPDAKLSKLLKYEEYKKDVKEGKITVKDKKSENGTRVMEDDSLFHYTIMKLIQPHFLKRRV